MILYSFQQILVEEFCDLHHKTVCSQQKFCGTSKRIKQTNYVKYVWSLQNYLRRLIKFEKPKKCFGNVSHLERLAQNKHGAIVLIVLIRNVFDVRTNFKTSHDSIIFIINHVLTFFYLTKH